MAACTCDYTLQNSGLPNCVPLQKYTVGVIFVPYWDSAGALNKVASNANITSAYVTAKLNDEQTQRWYPLMNVKNANSEKGENIVETFEDQSKFIITSGVRSESFILAAASNVIVGKIESWQCDEMGVYYVDKDGNLIGMIDEAGDLLPIKIQKGSLSAIYNTPTPTTTAKVVVKYDFEVDESDANLRMFTNTVQWSTVNGLLDVNAVISGISQTGFTAALTYDYGYGNSKNVVKGLVAADFSLYNVTDSASITITSVTESTVTPGTYVFVMPSQTVSDELRLSASKNGFDFSRIDDTTFEVV